MTTARQVPVTIDRSSPVPLYHQLAEQLGQAITDGELQPGDPFENEVAVAERVQLSRPTVRRAIQELVDRGLLVRRRGLGTTVANQRVHRRVELTSLFDDLEREGRSPTTRLLEHEETTDEEVARELDLPADQHLLHLVRLRCASGVPLAIMRNWLLPVPGLTTEELEGGGLYAALRSRGIKPVVARQTIGARMPSDSEREYLDIPDDTPVLTMVRVAFDAESRPVEYGSHCYRAPEYSIDLMIDER